MLTLIKSSKSTQTRRKDKKQHIAAEEYRLSQHRKVLEASQRRISAEVQLCEQQQREARILGFLEYQGVNLKNLEPQVAFALGNIVREILVAKKQLARYRAEETREILQAQVNSTFEICASLSDANIQMGPILKLLHDNNWPFDLPASVFSFEGHPLPTQRFPSGSFSSESWVSPPPTQSPSFQTIRFPWEHVDQYTASDSDEEEGDDFI